MAPQLAVVTVPPEAMSPYVEVVQAVQTTTEAPEASVQAEHPATPDGEVGEAPPVAEQDKQTPDNK